jgi:hypothetical protein
VATLIELNVYVEPVFRHDRSTSAFEDNDEQIRKIKTYIACIKNDAAYVWLSPTSRYVDNASKAMGSISASNESLLASLCSSGKISLSLLREAFEPTETSSVHDLSKYLPHRAEFDSYDESLLLARQSWCENLGYTVENTVSKD